MALTVHQTYLTQNDCYRSGGALTPQGLMLHSVGCAQPDAMAFVQSWNQPGVKACVHGFIDANTGAVYQTLPWTCRGWHGGGSSNNTHIGVEMCEPASIRYTSGANFLDQDPAATEAAVLRTYGTAVDLFAQLCRTFSWTLWAMASFSPTESATSGASPPTTGTLSTFGPPSASPWIFSGRRSLPP